MNTTKPYGRFLLIVFCLQALACSHQPSPLPPVNEANKITAREEADLIFLDARIYPAPDAAPIDRGTVVVNNGKIVVARQAREGDAQLQARKVINANGRALTAGLWNSHVHFTAPDLATNPQRVISGMLLRYGFTHVVDTGSVPEQTLGLRDAIATGRLNGPKIVLANGSFVYTNGTPSYLPGIKLPEVADPAAAAPMVNGALDMGADGIKLFAGSFITPTKTILLPPDIIRAITEAAHQRDSFVMAHPTSIEGLSNAVRGNVDVIAHTTAPEANVPASVLALMRQQDTALIPTLMLWRNEMLKFGQSTAQADFMENAAISQLRALHNAGVTILFGTDVGYMADFNTAAEYRLMQQAGMDWQSIHAALTTEPTKRFGKFAGRNQSTVHPGADADIVLFNGDPAKQIESLADVAYTVVDGVVVYSNSD